MADWAVDYSKADDTGAGNSWAAAKKTLKAATDAAAAGDTIYVHVGTDQVVTVDTVWTIAAGVRILASNDTANFPPTVLSTAGGIISPTSGMDYSFAGGPFLIRGFRLKPGTSTGLSTVTLLSTGGYSCVAESCAFDFSAASNTGNRLRLGSTTTNIRNAVTLKNCTVKFSNASNYILAYCPAIFEGLSLESGGTVPTSLFSANYSCAWVDFIGSDLSGLGSNTLLAAPGVRVTVAVKQCKLHSGALSGALTDAGAEIFVYDSASGDTHYQFAHYIYTGSTTVSTAIYCDDGATYDTAGNKHSWVVAGNANTNRANPYVSPWITRYNEATSAITPELEVLRNDSATEFTDTQVWSEWMLKTAGGSPLSSLYSDYGGHLSAGTNQGAGVGLSGWTGESGTAWSGRLECPSVTPAEIGHISARVVVAGNYTVYVDPTIRGT